MAYVDIQIALFTDYYPTETPIPYSYSYPGENIRIRIRIRTIWKLSDPKSIRIRFERTETICSVFIPTWQSNNFLFLIRKGILPSCTDLEELCTAQMQILLYMVGRTLWTIDRLSKRGLPHPRSCAFCDQQGETINYFLVSYPKSL